MGYQRIPPDTPFFLAARAWQQQRRVHLDPRIAARLIRANTERSEAQYLRSLNLFFEVLPINTIHLGHLREYQRARSIGDPPFIRRRRPQDMPGPCPAGPKKINQELSLLCRVLKTFSALNSEIESGYMPLLVEETEIERALSPEQQQIWLDSARQVSERVFWYSLLAFQTTASTNELRALRIGDVNLHHQTISVPWPGAKNRRRHRTIPLVTAEGNWAAEQLVRQAAELGSVDPQHFLFPLRDRRMPHDPTRPMTVSGLKKPWQQVRDASDLQWFRPYDTRHTAITRLAEAGIPVATIMEMAGHITERMRRHYTHISEQTVRRQLAAAYRKPVQAVRSYHPEYPHKIIPRTA